MVVILKNNPDEAQLQSLIHWLETKNIQVTQSLGESNHILGLIGDTSRIDMDLIGALDIVESVRRIQEPYKKANRKFHPDDTVISVKGTTIGNGELALIAGPGAVENEEQMLLIAQEVKAAGATIGAARSSAVPPPTPSRASARKVSTRWSRRATPPACRSSRRSCASPSSTTSRTSTSSRSAPAT